jgi:hypothetical protein
MAFGKENHAQYTEQVPVDGCRCCSRNDIRARSRARSRYRGRASPGDPGSPDCLADMPAGSAAAQAGGFTCASVLVPLDYQDPGGPQIKLALVRHAATGPVRRGVIFINPGGPGGAGTVQIPAWIGFMPSVLLRDYDIVSWTPEASATARRPSASPAAPPKRRSSAHTPISPSPRASRRASSAGGPRSGRSALRGTEHCSSTSQPRTRHGTWTCCAAH